MQSKTFKYSAAVFMAGMSYGILATVVKLAFAAGFAWNQVIASQTMCGFIIFVVVFAVVALVRKSYQRVSPKQVLRMVGLGLIACTTTVFYGIALFFLPVSIALTLLFQFVWIGIVIQVVTTRRKPHVTEIIAVLVIFAGTLLGSGLFDARLDSVNPLGVVCGLVSAVSCAFFIHLSGRVETGVPHIQRGMIISFGTVIVGFSICPDFFTSGVIQAGILKYGFVLGTFAYVFPIVLLGIGTPHLSTGLSAILTSAELPGGIICSVLIVNETITILQIFGVAAVLAGVVIAQLPYLLPKKIPPEKSRAKAS